MEPSWDWNGSRWWKFDFHTHTPASEDYGKGPNQEELRKLSPEEWLLAYMRAEIDCVAVTDHNSGVWIDKLRIAYRELENKKPEGFRPLHLFPGVEISVNGGIHILAILSPERSTSDIDTLLGIVGYRGEKGKTDACTDKSSLEVIDGIDKAGGIAIPAHVDEPNGLFVMVQGTTLKQTLERNNIIALELHGTSFQKPQIYHDLKLSLADVLGSDSHHPSRDHGERFPGSHYTWIKMGTPSLDGLRLALLDGSPLSVLRSDKYTEDPNRHAPLVIESVQVHRARYMGRSKDFEVTMNPWMNAIIGGRGTGKSTLVEFLRTALRRENELPDSLKDDFKKYTAKCESRGDEGLLTKDSEFMVVYRKDGRRFRVQWSPSGDVDAIMDEVQKDQWIRSEGDVKRRFPVRIYSQKEIFQLAKEPNALLRVVDDSIEVDRRSWDEKWREATLRFLSIRTTVREIESGLADESVLEGELDDVRRKLSVFEEAEHSETLNYWAS